MNILVTTPYGRFYVPGLDAEHAGPVVDALSSMMLVENTDEGLSALNNDPVNSRVAILGSVEIRPPLELDKTAIPLLKQLRRAMREEQGIDEDKIRQLVDSFNPPPKGPSH